jgi:hypothetical protein
MQRRESDDGPAKRLVRANKRKVRRAQPAPTLTILCKQLDQDTHERDEAIAGARYRRLNFSMLEKISK